MKLNKYKFKDSDNEFLIYTLTEELSMPLDDLGLELIEENPDLEENKLLPLIKAEDLLERLVKRSRSRDTVLSEESIDSWNNLKAAYFAMKRRIIYFPKRIRDFINDKYSEIVNNYDFRSNVMDTMDNTSDDNDIPGSGRDK